MEFGEILSSVIGVLTTLAVGVISYFVKKTIDRQDKFVTKEEIKHYESIAEECRKDIKHLNDRYATKAEVEEIKRNIYKIGTNIDEIRETTVKSQEFVRVMTRLESKIDNLMERRNN